MDDFDIPNTPSPSGRDSSGILRTKIQLGRKPAVIMPFYLMKPDLPGNFWQVDNICCVRCFCSVAYVTVDNQCQLFSKIGICDFLSGYVVFEEYCT